MHWQLSLTQFINFTRRKTELDPFEILLIDFLQIKFKIRLVDFTQSLTSEKESSQIIVSRIRADKLLKRYSAGPRSVANCIECRLQSSLSVIIDVNDIDLPRLVVELP